MIKRISDYNWVMLWAADVCCSLSDVCDRESKQNSPIWSDSINKCLYLDLDYQVLSRFDFRTHPNFWSCEVVNLSNQKSSSYWQWQHVCTFMSISHEGPKMLLLFYCPKFDDLILKKIVRIVATRCQIFLAKMHQIQFRLGLRPRPRWGSLQRSPDRFRPAIVSK